MAKAPATPRKPTAKAAKPKADSGTSLKGPKPAASQWRTVASTPDEVAAWIDQTLQGKLDNVAGAKAKKAAAKTTKIHNDVADAKKSVPKSRVGTKKADPIVKLAPKSPRKRAAKAPAQPVGRPSKFTQAIADEICGRLGKGEPLAEICRSDNMPAVRTVSDWKEAHPDFSAKFAHAREEGFDAIASDCMKIADDGSNDTYVDSEGLVKTDYDIVQRSKLRIETRLKLLAKWDPKRYGDKVDVNHGGQEGNPIDVRTKVVMVPPKQAAEVFTRPFKAEEN